MQTPTGTRRMKNTKKNGIAANMYFCCLSWMNENSSVEPSIEAM